MRHRSGDSAKGFILMCILSALILYTIITSYELGLSFVLHCYEHTATEFSCKGGFQ